MDHLKNVRYDRALKLANGRFVHNYRELASELKLLSDTEFSVHVSKGIDDFSDWISSNYGDGELLSRLKGVASKKKYAALIEKRIKELEKDSSPKETDNQERRYRGPSYSFLWMVLSFILVIVIVFLSTNHSVKEDEYSSLVDSLNEKVSDLETQSAIKDNRISILESENKKLSDNVNILEEENSAIVSRASIPGPKDRIAEDKIMIKSNKVEISVDSPLIAKFTDTGSMLPSITSTSNAIEIVPDSPAEISVGDIVSYKTEEGLVVIHRVIETGTDQEGWYGVMQGDNRNIPDQDKVRFSQVERIVVAIIY